MTNWDPATAAKMIRRRRRLRFIGVVAASIFVGSVVADHLRAQNRHGDDWLRFDGRQVQFVKAATGTSIAVHDEDTDGATIVVLQGIRPARGPWDAICAERLDTLIAGKKVTLHLKPTDPRDELGRLKADVFFDNGVLVSGEIVGEGLALADRNSASDFLTTITQKQTQARKHRLGLWNY